MADQLFTEGDTIKHKGQELECVIVQYRERDGVRENFVYGFRSKDELEAERESARKVQEAKDNQVTEEK